MVAVAALQILGRCRAIGVGVSLFISAALFMCAMAQSSTLPRSLPALHVAGTTKWNLAPRLCQKFSAAAIGPVFNTRFEVSTSAAGDEAGATKCSGELSALVERLTLVGLLCNVRHCDTRRRCRRRRPACRRSCSHHVCHTAYALHCGGAGARKNSSITPTPGAPPKLPAPYSGPASPSINGPNNAPSVPGVNACK